MTREQRDRAAETDIEDVHEQRSPGLASNLHVEAVAQPKRCSAIRQRSQRPRVHHAPLDLDLTGQYAVLAREVPQALGKAEILEVRDRGAERVWERSWRKQRPLWILDRQLPLRDPQGRHWIPFARSGEPQIDRGPDLVLDLRVCISGRFDPDRMPRDDVPPDRAF